MNKLFGAVLLAAAAQALIVSREQKANHGWFIEDDEGRIRIFHGVNAVFKIPPWHPVTDAWNSVDSMTEEDAINLRNWGFNMVRLGVMWPGAEPEKDKWDMAYLQKMRDIADVLGKHGIYTLVDLHQDLGSRFVCGEGIPDWAVAIREDAAEFPSPVASGPYPLDKDGYPQLEWCLNKSFGLYYGSYAVESVFQNFYENTNGAADHFALFWNKVGSVFKDCPTVLGYELINEPWPGDCFKHPSLVLPGKGDEENLYPLYMKAAEALRAEDPNAIIFFEKALTNVVGNLGFPTVPGGDEYKNRTVFSWHNYCGTVDRSGNPRNFLLCEGQQAVQWRIDLSDIDTIDAGTFLSEFGAVAGNETKALQDISWVVEKADEELLGWAYWQYKAYHDITTASNEVESFYNADGTLQTQKVDVLNRAYAQAINGLLTKNKYTAAEHKLEVAYTLADRHIKSQAKTEIYIAPIIAASASKNVEISYNPSNAIEFDIVDGYMTVSLTAAATAGTTIELTITPMA